MPGWAKTFFHKEVFSPGDPSAMAQAPPEARFAAKVLGLRKGFRVLDACCGVGRHSFLLASAGAHVTGIDVTDGYLRQAKRRAGKRENPVFLKADVRRLPFREIFDAAICLWTSFGYFDRAAQDLTALKSIHRALRPGGFFLIDVVNAEWLKANFQPRQWRPGPGKTLVLEEARLLRGRDPSLDSVWTIIAPGRPWRRARLRLRLYDQERLERALKAAGFKVKRRWGGFDGQKFSPQSPRLLILAQRPR